MTVSFLLPTGRFPGGAGRTMENTGLSVLGGFHHETLVLS